MGNKTVCFFLNKTLLCPRFQQRLSFSSFPHRQQYYFLQRFREGRGEESTSWSTPDVVNIISSYSFNHIEERRSELGCFTQMPLMCITVDMQGLTFLISLCQCFISVLSLELIPGHQQKVKEFTASEKQGSKESFIQEERLQLRSRWGGSLRVDNCT